MKSDHLCADLQRSHGMSTAGHCDLSANLGRWVYDAACNGHAAEALQGDVHGQPVLDLASAKLYIRPTRKLPHHHGQRATEMKPAACCLQLRAHES